MNRYFSAIIVVFVLIISLAQISQATGLYNKPEFRGKLIDAKTKEPIEGTVVVVLYDKRPLIGGLGGPNSYVFHVKEALTDSKGEFLIPAYSSVLLFTEDAGVRFIFYKPGYMADYGPTYVDAFLMVEYFSAGEVGKEAEINVKQGRPASYKGPMGIVELKKVSPDASMPPCCIPADYGAQQLPLLYKAINVDRRNRGLEGEEK